jgi:hypothetical protein
MEKAWPDWAGWVVKLFFTPGDRGFWPIGRGPILKTRLFYPKTPESIKKERKSSWFSCIINNANHR